MVSDAQGAGLGPNAGGGAAADFFHMAKDERYLKLLSEEAEHWDKNPDRLLRNESWPRIRQYENARLTGDSDRQWFEVISDYDPFRSACILGAGPGDVESELLRRNPELHLSIYDISGESLQRMDTALGEAFPGRAEIRQEDLNFVQLPAQMYDLVVANSCIHHIVNLEHLACEINRSLQQHGYFFMRDTVGESYFQFSSEKKRIFQTYLDATRGSSGTRLQVNWPDRNNWEYTPFESVRSQEILEIFPRYLDEIRVTTCSALLLPMLFVEPAAARGGNRLQRVLRRLRRGVAARLSRLLAWRADLHQQIATGDLLFQLDSILCDTGYLLPGLAFAIYRRRAT